MLRSSTAGVLDAAAGSGRFLGADWGSIAIVFVVAMVATVLVVSLYALGLRLLAVGSPDDGAAPVAGDTRPVIATVGAIVCIAIGGIAVLYGVYLVVPQFH